VRVGYVCADQGISVRGVKGASAHLRSLSGALARRGHEVMVACRRLDGPNAVPDGVTTVAFDSAPTPPALRDLFIRFGTEVVLERHSLQGGSARLAATELDLPYLLEVNAPLADEAARYRGLQDVELWRRREAEEFRAAQQILTVSTAMRDHVLAAGADLANVIVVPNGVDVARFAGRHGLFRLRAGLAGRYVVGFTGSLKAWHGIDTLLAAFAGLDEGAVLLIVGDGPERSRLQRLADDLGIRERTLFVGAVPHGEVPEWLGAMDVGVAPYAFQPVFYFSPLKIAEYLAAGLPVVATEQGDIPRQVGDAGLLVPPGDAEALRRALETLRVDPALRHRYRMKA
jgi:glycosyltransferase involved in cell wall biosynthesis